MRHIRRGLLPAAALGVAGMLAVPAATASATSAARRGPTPVHAAQPQLVQMGSDVVATVPAAGFDPLKATNAQLVANGYPARPAPGQPQAWWLQNVAGTYVLPVPGPTVNVGHAHTRGTRSSGAGTPRSINPGMANNYGDCEANYWSGFENVDSAKQGDCPDAPSDGGWYSAASADIEIAGIQDTQDSWSTMSEWVGLGQGYSTSDILNQAGYMATWFPCDLLYCDEHIWPFWEEYETKNKYQEHTLSLPDFTPGVTLSVLVEDRNSGCPKGWSWCAWYSMSWDGHRTSFFGTDEPANPGSISAEYISEDPCTSFTGSNQENEFAAFGGVGFSHLEAQFWTVWKDASSLENYMLWFGDKAGKTVGFTSQMDQSSSAGSSFDAQSMTNPSQPPVAMGACNG